MTEKEIEKADYIVKYRSEEVEKVTHVGRNLISVGEGNENDSFISRRMLENDGFDLFKEKPDESNIF